MTKLTIKNLLKTDLVIGNLPIGTMTLAPGNARTLEFTKEQLQEHMDNFEKLESLAWISIVKNGEAEAPPKVETETPPVTPPAKTEITPEVILAEEGVKADTAPPALETKSDGIEEPKKTSVYDRKNRNR